MHEKDRPAESACDLIRNFWHDTKKYSDNPANEIIDSDTIAEDIPELIIDNANENNDNQNDNDIDNDNVDESNDTNITTIPPPPTIEQNSTNMALCGTCPEIPYSIATHFCADCKENICNECKRGHGIFRLTRDHVISPL